MRHCSRSCSTCSLGVFVSQLLLQELADSTVSRYLAIASQGSVNRTVSKRSAAQLGFCCEPARL